MATRADHAQWADELVWKARRYVRDRYAANDAVDYRLAGFWVAAAQVHATLATVGESVAGAVAHQEKVAARAVGASEGRQICRCSRSVASDRPHEPGAPGCLR